MAKTMQRRRRGAGKDRKRSRRTFGEYSGPSADPLAAADRPTTLMESSAQAPPAIAAPAPANRRNTSDPGGSFAVIAALGATFAGYVTHGRNPDWLATAIAVAITFFAALVALYVLHVVYRLVLAAVRLALPVALLLLVGCALDWQWAETVVGWLRDAGASSMHVAAQALRVQRGG